MKHYIIGTAGHVDHGKTMLVKALTGKDTDRLKEEKDRGISIELGFAPLKLPSGNTASIIDVPGHERFIKNMLAGVGGIDLVLFVIAADEGIMPQTREHLDIIQLLQIPKGIVVITKTDLVDEDWLQLVHEEITDFLKGTMLEHAPLIDVSVVSGEGIESLKNTVDGVIEDIEGKEFAGRPRLPIDRIFTITGFGTVVTGTLLAGQLKVGDPVEILPEGLDSRVRSLQVHSQKVEKALAGQRVAVNLTGLEVNEINRGSVLITPHTLQSSYRLDGELTLLAGAEKALVNRARIRFHIGAKEALGRVVLLDRDELKPGDAALVQLELEEPVVCGKNDRFVIRSYSPLRTVGGGAIIDPSPVKHKRFKDEVLEALRTKQKGSPAELIEQFLQNKGKIILPLAELEKEMDMPLEIIRSTLPELSETKIIKIFKPENTEFVIPVALYNHNTAVMQEVLAKYHQDYPLRAGYSKEELRSRLFASTQSKLFSYLLSAMEADHLVKATDKFLSLYDFHPVPNDSQQKVLQQIQNKYKTAAFQPPGWQEVINDLKLAKEEAEELLFYLLEKNQLIKISDDFYLYKEILAEGVAKIKNHLQEKGETTLGEVRDIMGTSRKYALPLLEYFDHEKITRRVGDKRVLY